MMLIPKLPPPSLLVDLHFFFFSSSGEHLRICPQGYTCCTSEMEENFANKSRSEFESMLKEATRSAQANLTSQYKIFDGKYW